MLRCPHRERQPGVAPDQEACQGSDGRLRYFAVHSTPTPTPPRRPLPTPGQFDRAGCAIALFVVLPVLGLCAELATGMLGEFHTVFPSPWHKLLVAGAVFANVLLHLQPRWLDVRPALAATLLGYVSATALLYAVVFLPAFPLLVAAVFLAGLGLLAAAPYWVCAGLFVLWQRHLRRPGPRPASHWLLLTGAATAAVLASFAGQADDPNQAHSLAELAQARRSLAPSELGPLLTACREAPLGPQLAACERGFGFGHGTLHNRAPGRFWFTVPATQELRTWVDAVELRGAFHLAHGFDWRNEQSPHPGGLQWSASRYEATVEPDAALAVVDWHVEVRSNADRNQEAEFAIQLPPGGAATGLSLWIAGTERPAAFASAERTTKAYEAVVATMRDPALLTEVGPERLHLRLFPVSRTLPPMRARVRFVVPLQLGEGDQHLHLPTVRGKDLPLAQPGHTVSVAIGDDRLSGVWTDATLRRPLPIPAGAKVAGCTDARGALVQRLEPIATAADTAAEATAVVVVEASRSIGRAMPQLSKLLDAMPPTTLCTVLVASGEHFTQRSDRAAAPELRAWLDQQPNVGGVDPRPALRAALDLARGGSGRVLWLHGDCPRVAEPWGPNTDRRGEVLAVALTDGVHVVRDDPAFAGLVRDATSGATPDERLHHLGRLLARGGPSPGGFADDRRQRRFERSDQLPTGITPASDHLARLWAASTARDLVASGDPTAGKQLAASYRLVTAGVGAVVLESADQYAAHGLDPGAPIGFEPPGSAGGAPVPEPGTLLLVGSGLLAALGWRRRSGRRQTASTAE